MHSCNLVPMTMVQGKLDELLPLLTRSDLLQDSRPAQIKMNFLYLIRKVLTKEGETASKDQSANLQLFLPKILFILEKSCKTED